MEQEQQQLEAPIEQQSINSTQERENRASSSAASSGGNTGGSAGEDPNERARHFKHLSETSIQAKEAAR
jgi:hypothetical protein